MQWNTFLSHYICCSQSSLLSKCPSSLTVRRKTEMELMNSCEGRGWASSLKVISQKCHRKSMHRVQFDEGSINLVVDIVKKRGRCNEDAEPTIWGQTLLFYECSSASTAESFTQKVWTSLDFCFASFLYLWHLKWLRGLRGNSTSCEIVICSNILWTLCCRQGSIYQWYRTLPSA